MDRTIAFHKWMFASYGTVHRYVGVCEYIYINIHVSVFLAAAAAFNALFNGLQSHKLIVFASLMLVRVSRFKEQTSYR